MKVATSQLTTKKRKKMKKNQFIFYLATIISGMLSVASCSDEDGAVATGKQASLEIQVSGVQSTRSIIEEQVPSAGISTCQTM